MNTPLNWVLAVGVSYLIGSIPTAYLFGKFLKGIDIRKFGSGNVGATNAFRVLGKGPGTLVLLIDILKGILPTALAADIFSLNEIWQRVLLGLVAVAGHNWTIFLQFKGGKGIATGLGVLVGLCLKIAILRPVVAGTLFAWGVVFLSTGFVSLASLVAATVLPVLMALTGQSLALTVLGIVLCVFVIFRHRPNIKRLVAGQEHRVKIFSSSK